MSFGEFERGHGSTPMSDINMTPLVDVMLVLLIIFMVTAPLMTQAIGVDLPRTAADGSRQESVKVLLAIDRDGAMRWDGAAITYAELGLRLSASAARRPQPELHLQADRVTPYERIARVLGAARAAGLQRVGFVTLPEASP